jgi:hypothetical protein
MVSRDLYSFCKLNLFQKFWLTHILVGYETNPNGKIISLYFQRVQECPDWMLYESWVLVLRWIDSELDSNQILNWIWTPTSYIDSFLYCTIARL